MTDANNTFNKLIYKKSQKVSINTPAPSIIKANGLNNTKQQ